MKGKFIAMKLCLIWLQFHTRHRKDDETKKQNQTREVVFKIKIRKMGSMDRNNNAYDLGSIVRNNNAHGLNSRCKNCF